MIGKLDDYFRFNETTLNLRAQRQQLLASNIANADTPNYKARDIDFGATLQGVLAGTLPQLNKTSANHLNGNADTGPGGAPLLYRGVQQGSIDGNTVDMDVERTQFADNALRYEASVTLLNSQIRSLMTAITGGQ
ncbi:MAG: flagellar basal body rod protein FlgB [Burkholderiales bacterium]|nr:flagellar basal body rod protein FlgB [Burkholderiales bacterium]